MFEIKVEKSWYDAIYARASVRTFTGEPTEEQLLHLGDLCRKFSWQGVRMRLFRGPGMKSFIKGTQIFCAIALKKGTAPELAGFYGEALVLEAVSMGLGACWLGMFYHDMVKNTFKPAQDEEVVLLIALFSIIVLPELASTISSLAVSIMHFVPVAQEWISGMLEKLADYPEIHDAIASMIPDLNKLATSIITLVQKYAVAAAASIVSGISTVFGSVTDVIVSFVFAIYVLLQKEALSRQCKKLVYAFLPRTFCDETLDVARMTHRSFFSYVTIQCTEAVILGALCFVGMLIFRFPYALVISVIMVFCALIPIYGAIFSCVIGALLVLIENPMQAIGFVVFILVLQQIETNLIYPRVVSTSINLPPMWVLLAVTVGGGLFGIPGMLVAVPITSICYTLLGQKTHRRLAARGIREEELEELPK